MNRNVKTNKENATRSLPDKQLDLSLRTLARHIHQYAHLLDIRQEDLEQLNRQYLAFNWLVTMEEKLKEYLLEVRGLKQTLRSTNIAPRFLRFYDLPRPPLFYPEGNLDQWLEGLIGKIRSSAHYNEGIGGDLGLE